MATYKELDPIIRLVILKALCEIRADVIYLSLYFIFFIIIHDNFIIFAF